MSNAYVMGFSAIELAAGTQAKQRRFDYDGDGNPIYVAWNTNLSASTSDRTWLVWKYTWSSGNLTLIQGPRETAWDERATGW